MLTGPVSRSGGWLAGCSLMTAGNAPALDCRAQARYSRHTCRSVLWMSQRYCCLRCRCLLPAEGHRAAPRRPDRCALRSAEGTLLQEVSRLATGYAIQFFCRVETITLNRADHKDSDPMLRRLNDPTRCSADEIVADSRSDAPEIDLKECVGRESEDAGEPLAATHWHLTQKRRPSVKCSHAPFANGIWATWGRGDTSRFRIYTENT